MKTKPEKAANPAKPKNMEDKDKEKEKEGTYKTHKPTKKRNAGKEESGRGTGKRRRKF